MKLIYVSHEGGTLRLLSGNASVPRPASHEVLVQVCAAGVTPTELQWYPTTHTKEGTARVGAVPGHEFSGVVAEAGEQVREFAVGDEVYGMNDWFQQGATAEYCLAVPAGLAKKPAALSHTEAAAVPIAALTAWQGLFTHAHLKAGDRLLLHGGAGSVGSFVIQLAKLHGAEVIATASRRNTDFVRSLKADKVVNYETTRFEDATADIDVVFDAVGGDSLERSWPLLKAGGRAVTIAADSETTADPRIKEAFFIVEPNHEQLADLGPLLEAGYLRPFVGTTASLEQAAALYRGIKTDAVPQGKSVVVVL